MIQLVLQGIPWSQALAYLDDVLVHARDFSGHLSALDRVLEAHIRAGLKLAPAKCKIFRQEAEYLGHLVNKDGIRPLPSHTSVIRDWAVPSSKAMIRTFVGKINYYRFPRLQ